MSHSRCTLNKTSSDLHRLPAKHLRQDETSREREKLAGNITVLQQGDLQPVARDRHKATKDRLLSLFFQVHKTPK